jgi:hypothetical protein
MNIDKELIDRFGMNGNPGLRADRKNQDPGSDINKHWPVTRTKVIKPFNRDVPQQNKAGIPPL